MGVRVGVGMEVAAGEREDVAVGPLVTGGGGVAVGDEEQAINWAVSEATTNSGCQIQRRVDETLFIILVLSP